MFTKSTLFNRNDPPPVRETPAPSSPGARTATTATSNPTVRTLTPQRETSTPPPVRAEESARPASTGAPEGKDKESVGVDTGTGGMGARLIVGPEVKLKGAEILDCDTLVVEGRVEATMDSRVIRIAENGSFSGKVSIDVAEIHGSFDGELTARSQLIIHSTGRVSGTIRFGTLVVDEGGELCGDINVLVQKSEKSEKPLSTASNTLSASSASNTSLAKAESPQARSEAAAA